MRNLLLVALLGLFNLATIAQPISTPISSIPADSIPALLCKKWIAQYTMMGEVKISPKPGVPVPVFDFKKDKSLLFSGGDAAPAKGNWAYDRTKRCVNVSVNGHHRGTIVQLEPDLLVMLMNMGEATPDDPAPIIMVFNMKIK